MDKREIRNLCEQLEIRSVQEQQDSNIVTLEGYIAKFNSLTTLWQGYNEMLDSHCFDKTLADGHNIFLLYAHDWSKPLASTETGTLVLTTDEIGLHFIATVDKSISYINDVCTLIKSGLTVGCSFGFYIINDNEVYDSATQTWTDTILEVQLLEGSVLSNPQYSDTTVSARGKDRIEQILAEKEAQEKELNNELELLKIELDL